MGIRLGSLFSEVTRPRGRREMDSQGMKGFYSTKKSEWEETQGNGASVWRPAGSSSSEICLINTSELGCGTQRGASEGKGLYVGPASLLESLGVPCWVYFSHSGGMDAEDSWGLVAPWHSAHVRSRWKTTRTNVMVLPLSLSIPNFSHVQMVPHLSKCLILLRIPERRMAGSQPWQGALVGLGRTGGEDKAGRGERGVA